MSYSEEQEFKNDHLTVKMSKAPGCKIRLEVTVSPAATDAAYHKAIKAVNKEVSFPGFRKGKAPDNLILKNYASAIDQEWREIVLNTAFKESMELVQERPLSQNSVKAPQIKSMSRETGSQFILEYDAAPNIPQVDPSALAIKVIHPRAITQQEVDDSIANVRLHYAEWTEVTDRPAQTDDFVSLDIENLDATPSEMICEDTQFELAEGKMGNWMRNLVIGLSVNESAEGTSEKEPEPSCEACDAHEPGHHHEHPEFKPTRCKITVKSIRTAKPAELNDDFAKKVGAESVEDLPGKVKAYLENMANKDCQEMMRRQVEQALLQAYPFEVPLSMVNYDYSADVQEQVKDIENKDERKAKTKELEEQYQKQVSDSVRLMLLADSVAHENNIQVSSDEVMREFYQQMMAAGTAMDKGIIDKSMEPKQMQSRVYNHLKSEKVLDALIEKANKIDS